MYVHETNLPTGYTAYTCTCTCRNFKLHVHVDVGWHTVFL